MADPVLEKLDLALAGIKEAQDLATHNQVKLTELNALDEEKFQKIADDVTKHLDEMNNLKAKQDTIDADVKSLETKLARPGAKGEKLVMSKSTEVAYYDYLRNRSKGIDTEALTEIMRATVVDSFKGISEEMIERHTKDMVVGNNPAGGYLVRPEFANFVVTRQFETSPMRQICGIQTISTESLEIPVDDDEAEAVWEGEVDTPNATSTPSIGQMTIHTHSLKARPKASQKFLDDVAIDVEAWLRTKVADIFTRKENTSFVEGDGSKQPSGFLTYPAWAAQGVYERDKIEQRTSGTNGGFGANSFIDLQTDLLELYQPNATWLMKRKTFTEVMKLVDGEDNYLINFQMMSQGAAKILLGAPVRFADDMPAYGTVDNLAVAYGDFKRGYTIVDRLGITILVDPYTAEPFVVYKTRKRVGGAATNFQSIKLMKLTA